jgi:hypothetical protein
MAVRNVYNDTKKIRFVDTFWFALGLYVFFDVKSGRNRCVDCMISEYQKQRPSDLPSEVRLYDRVVRDWS